MVNAQRRQKQVVGVEAPVVVQAGHTAPLACGVSGGGESETGKTLERC